MKVLYFGSYSLNNQRNAILIKGLRENGVEVIECKDGSKSLLLKYVKLFFKHLRFLGKYDVMIVGFSGQEMMPLARLLTYPPFSGLTRRPIVFDVFTSHYMGYILDRKYFSPKSLRAKYYHFLDYLSCHLADIVILDTQAHIDYFVKEFVLPKEKFRKIWLGANSEAFPYSGANLNHDSIFNVVFWGNFIPLQGVEYVIKAAKFLANEDINLYLIGGGQTKVNNEDLAKELELKNVEFTGKLSDQDRNQKIAEADVCLGAFGESIKAGITIQNKIFEALCSGRAVLTARTKAIEELLTDRENCLLCDKADPEDLVRKILELKNNSELKNKIAKNGHEFFVENLTEKKLGNNLLNVIKELS